MIDQREQSALEGWGSALRSARLKRRQIRRRSLGVGLLGAALLATIALPPMPRLVWNASASAPIGLYGVVRSSDIAPGDMVIARLSRPWRAFANARHYVTASVPLVKHVAAAPGDTVCAKGNAITINGELRAMRRLSDGRGRRMPWWEGCITLREGAVFLLTKSSASFDGRYFGPTVRGDIIGKAHLLWAQ